MLNQGHGLSYKLAKLTSQSKIYVFPEHFLHGLKWVQLFLDWALQNIYKQIFQWKVRNPL